MNNSVPVNSNPVIFIDPAIKEKPVNFVQNNITTHIDKKNHRLITISNSGESHHKTSPAQHQEVTSSGLVANGLMTTRSKIPTALAQAMTGRQRTKHIRYDEELKQLCVEKILNEKWPVSKVANIYDISPTNIRNWLMKHQTKLAIRDNTDYLAKVFHQRVIEVNYSRFAGQQQKDIPIARGDERNLAARKEINENDIVGHNRSLPALQNQPVVRAVAPDQPFWRPW